MVTCNDRDQARTMGVSGRGEEEDRIIGRKEYNELRGQGIGQTLEGQRRKVIS